MTDQETRESSPSPSPLQQAKQALLQSVEERLHQSGEDLRQLLDAFAEAVPGLQPPAPAPSPAPAPDEEAILSGVRDSLAAIDGAGSQSEALSRLLEQATRYCSRVALFLAGGDSDGSALLGWSATGFEQTGPSVEGLVLPLPEGSPWPAVLDGRGALLLSAAECAPLCSRIETALPRRGVLVPLVLRDKVEAVLYGDQQDEDPFSLEALQVLTHGAAQTLEVVPLRQRPGSPTLRVGDALLPAPTPEPVPPEPVAPEPPATAPPSTAPAAPAAAEPPAAEPSESTSPAETRPAEEQPDAGPPTLSTTPLEAVPDFGTATIEPEPVAGPSGDEAGPATEAPTPPTHEPQPTGGALAGSQPGLTRGERAAGFVLEPLDEEPETAAPEPAFDLEGVDDLELVDEGLQDQAPASPGPPTLAAPAPPAPTPPAPTPPAPAPPAAPEPAEAPEEEAEAAGAEDLFFEPPEAAPGPTPARAAPPPPEPPPPEPPTPPSPPPAAPHEEAPSYEAPPDATRDTQLIGALSQPPAPGPAQPPPTPPLEDAGGAVSTGGEVVPPADIEGPGWAFSGKPTSPQAGTEPLHDEARRLARLLVSEIKLYNEELIAEGRRKGNIYQELREDIDRSRQMYEERIDEQVRSSSDYFREELIRSLAGGDASVMGL